jgi:hypothetical protein
MGQIGRWIGGLAVLLLAAGASFAARATDLAPPPRPMVAKAPALQIPPAGVLVDPGDRWEVRAGVFIHGVGNVEHDTYDINGELVSPRLPFELPGYWRNFVPRIHVGGSANLSGRTSFAYTGVLWTFPIYRGIFFETFIGPAVHNGVLAGDATHSVLGCHTLFHAGASLGYRLDDHWSVIGTFEHLSNGKQLFGIDCGTNQNLPGSANQGLNNYGLRVGYSF